uniref:Uncharacterized protein MANES_03G045900 n=1 Tax=Rhizophora mucronata TaxID=61149 RepID=A0A2P2L1S2_RHIMU
MFQISSLSSFEYVEPSGKDMGINVRKKAENITSLLNNKEKIQEARDKAAANRDKYFGLSSTGITYKSGSGSFNGSSFHSSDQYGSLSSTRGSDSYRDSYKGGDYNDEAEKDTYGKSRHGDMSDNRWNSRRTSSSRSGIKDQNNISYSGSKASAKLNDSNKSNSVPPQHSSALPCNYGDVDDDFDPRGTLATSKYFEHHLR